MTVTCYNCSDDPDKMGKTNKTTIKAATTTHPYEPVNDISGVVILDYFAEIENCNYVQIDDKYYFVDSKERLKGGMIALNVSVDVLDTYASALVNIPAIIVRTSADPKDNERIGWNNLLNDNLGVMQVNTEEFEVGFTGDSSFSYESDFIYLACIGCGAPASGIGADPTIRYDLYP